MTVLLLSLLWLLVVVCVTCVRESFLRLAQYLFLQLVSFPSLSLPSLLFQVTVVFALVLVSFVYFKIVLYF